MRWGVGVAVATEAFASLGFLGSGYGRGAALRRWLVKGGFWLAENQRIEKGAEPPFQSARVTPLMSIKHARVPEGPWLFLRSKAAIGASSMAAFERKNACVLSHTGT